MHLLIFFHIIRKKEVNINNYTYEIYFRTESSPNTPLFDSN